MDPRDKRLQACQQPVGLHAVVRAALGNEYPSQRHPWFVKQEHILEGLRIEPLRPFQGFGRVSLAQGQVRLGAGRQIHVKTDRAQLREAEPLGVLLVLGVRALVEDVDSERGLECCCRYELTNPFV